MPEVPSLVSLCIDTLARQLFLRDNDHDDDDDDDDGAVISVIYDLPFDLVNTLITRLPPFALLKFHLHMPFQDQIEEGFSHDELTNKRKRGRDWNLNTIWRNFFKLRWPHLIDQMQPADWLQAYWENHLQNCLDEAAEIALVPSFNGYLSDIQIPDTILKHIGFGERTNHSTCDHCKLSYHCLRFGSHASRLRLQNVLCTAETSDLLRECKLQILVLRCIRSKEQIDGLCKLLAQHSKTLTSLEFVHCTISADFINGLCGSMVTESVQRHGIQNFSIIASNFLEPCAVSLPSGLVSFLSSGRSLCSLKFSDSHLGRSFAKSLLVTILNHLPRISVLDLSDNRIGGWLYDVNRIFASRSNLCPGNGNSLQMLRVLNLRGNNLQKDDVENLRYALGHMPNLEELDISDNSIEDDGIRSLVPYFVGAAETCSHLSHLKFENCELSHDGVNNLLDALSTFKGPLKSLSIADNYLGSQVAGALGKFMSTPIEVLDVAGIGLGSSGFSELQDLIKEEVKLVKINISKNRGGMETLKFLSKLLSHAPRLVYVNAASNLLPIESLAIIFSTLKSYKGNLEHLDLSGHIWDYRQDRVSIDTEFVHNGKPRLILPLPSASIVPYDDDP
ncbi:hypothetical protein HN51_040124 [Arachis hypogaea]|uniref:Uncharacterized protein n=1 Tax=Arachis hypogaea TaxID=3818 RepID=A0A444YMD9_ARAHY|nr:uncharacterized protein LOC107647993 isoform X4 [Arachis ipaensis]XP_025663428.1 uncharacterized protein LOC112758860 isoform X4 [Arachis hypogaea]QHN85813.1 Tonsoku-like protein [Arachis hypogaea]RYR03110.1 hypothetical protein Ahy_B06g081939 isoform B [Arachis hypogaea]